MRQYKVGERIVVKLSGGRIAEATIRAITETTEGSTIAGIVRERDGLGLFVAGC